MGSCSCCTCQLLASVFRSYKYNATIPSRRVPVLRRVCCCWHPLADIPSGRSLLCVSFLSPSCLLRSYPFLQSKSFGSSVASGGSANGGPFTLPPRGTIEVDLAFKPQPGRPNDSLVSYSSVVVEAT